jgi:hypothetical protein
VIRLKKETRNEETQSTGLVQCSHWRLIGGGAETSVQIMADATEIELNLLKFSSVSMTNWSALDCSLRANRRRY